MINTIVQRIRIPKFTNLVRHNLNNIVSLPLSNFIVTKLCFGVFPLRIIGLIFCDMFAFSHFIT